MDLGLLVGSEALNRTSALIVLAAMALASRHLGPPASLTTLPVALLMVATMVTTVPAAHLMRRWGRKPGFLLGAGIGVAGAGVCTVALLQSHFALLCMGAFILGGVNGFATYYRFAAAETAQDDAKRKSKAISLVMAGGIVGALLGSYLSTYFVDWIPDYPFAGSFICIGALQLLVLLTLSLVSLPKPPESVSASSGRSLRELARQPYLLIAVLGAVTSWGLMSLLMHATPLAMARFGHSFADTTQVIMWHALGMYGPSFVTGHLIARFGEVKMMVCGFILIGAAAGINLVGIDFTHFLCGLTALGLGWNFLFVSSTSLLTTTYTQGEGAKVQSANDFSIFAVMVLSALGAGPLEHHVGWDGLNLLALAILGMACVSCVLLRLRAKRP